MALTSGVMCDGLGKHCLPTPKWAIHEYTSRRVDTNLLVQLEVCQRKLHCLLHLLLLDVHTTCEWERRGARGKEEEEETGRRKEERKGEGGKNGGGGSNRAGGGVREKKGEERKEGGLQR